MILDLLRKETAAVHRALEDEVKIQEVAADAGRYRQLLEDFYGFHGAMEERLHAVPGWLQQPHHPGERGKAAWLAEDLKALGLSAPEVAQLPRCSELPVLQSLAQAYGCAYVLEGSTLGGRHISHLLAQGPAAGWPHRFFAGYGAETGNRWKEFCAALENFSSENPESHAAILQAAGDTFATMRHWLARER